MKTTVKHVGSAREWEGPEENSIKHREVIEHWCDGGNVEMETYGSNGDWEICDPQFAINRIYRIKQREPKGGEVWINSSGDPFFVQCDGTEFIYTFLTDKISCNYESLEQWREISPDQVAGIKYAAPSVESYYAMKFLERAGTANFARDTLIEFAQLDR